ncbi:MAG: CPBP family intramembrane glutamic endopeptidase [Candidatus Omnitrophota bacterium]
MKPKIREWILLIGIALIAFQVWLALGYPEFAFVDLSVDRKKAIEKAQAYLLQRAVNPAGYTKAVTFLTDDWSDRYLQKTVGFKGEKEFIQRHGFELFSWKVRFFKELSKEEYTVAVSPKTGAIIGFKHLIEDTEPRPALDKAMALARAKEFLRDTQGLDLQEYDFHAEGVQKYDNRTDYSFSWEKKGVYIPWKKNEGYAKLLTGATISGNEVREYYIRVLDIPEKFHRYIENQMTSGEYLSTIAFIALLVLLAWSIYFVVKRQHTFVIRACRRLYFGLIIFLVAINLVYVVNNMQGIIMGYGTTSRMSAYLGLYLLRLCVNIIFVSIAFVMPGLAGESIRSEVLPEKPHASFLHYLRSGWLNRSLSRSVFLGYLVFFAMLGLQAGIFHIGQRYLGVWKEWLMLSQLSSSYVPFVSAFVVGATASLNEEVIFRLFGVSWATKYFKRLALGVFFSALLWGMGHARYAIFPTWFRSVEVTLLGCFLGFIFIRYGLIAVLIAHYLFDVFWGSAAYIFGHSSLFLFSGSLFIFVLPLGVAAAAYILNKNEKENDIVLALTSTQHYNLKILKAFLETRKSQGADTGLLKKELLAHNWDPLLIDLGIKEVFGP